MNARETILSRLRAKPLTAEPLPDLAEHDWTVYPDPLQRFQEVLQSVGGTLQQVESMSRINERLEQVEAYRDARVICSTIEGIGRDAWDPSQIDDPHRLREVDFAIAAGEFCVAENGAVWVTDRSLRHRALYFLCQHLALVVPAGEFVDNMHQAYGRIDPSRIGFGCFISGPSKTADIEQSLVIGAHGARSLTVVVCDG